jgi:hypothetical protein
MATKAAGGTDLHPQRSEGPKLCEGWRRPAILLRDGKRPRAAPENRRPQPLPVRAACSPIALSEGHGRGPLKRLGKVWVI